MCFQIYHIYSELFDNQLKTDKDNESSFRYGAWQNIMNTLPTVKQLGTL